MNQIDKAKRAKTLARKSGLNNMNRTKGYAAESRASIDRMLGFLFSRVLLVGIVSSTTLGLGFLLAGVLSR
ncbi:MAG: hypothetical protein EBU96_09510 [Actinobacteria bacterium]|nr:hypothetical protein [Actinomycetota bacterium]